MGLIADTIRKTKKGSDENGNEREVSNTKVTADPSGDERLGEDVTGCEGQRTNVEGRTKRVESDTTSSGGSDIPLQRSSGVPGEPGVIHIDDRIGSKDLHPIMLTICTSNPRPLLSKQQFGDVVWEGNGPKGRAMFGVERKNIGDLVGSLVSGRLVGLQIPGMVEAGYEFIWLAVEGYYRPEPVSGVLQEWKEDKRTGRGFWGDIRLGRNGRYMWRDLENWLTTLELFTGIRVRKTHSPLETAQMCVGLWRYSQKEWKDHRSHLNFHHSGPGTVIFHKPNIVMRMAKELDGVGWERAMEVSQRFKSPADMCNATVGKWMEIPGIGDTIAKRVWSEIATGVSRKKKEV